MKNVALHNLGCKVNAYEMEVMQQKLEQKGYRIVPFDTQADIYIINTCTVTNIADRKSRQMLHRVKTKNPDAVVVAVGCYVQTGNDNGNLDPSIDLAIGNNRKSEIVELLEAFLEEKEKSSSESEHETRTHIIDINHTKEYESMFLTQCEEHTRAYIKVQDGCNQFCSYCVIPYARGRVRSRALEDVIKEVAELAAKGYKEVVLTGIHLSSYGVDFDGVSYQGSSHLMELIRAVHEVPGITRIRLGSLEPRIVTREFARELKSLTKICPHFHLSLQSGCDETLKRMNRRYSAQEYFEKVEILREVFDHPGITTDVIVGFPGETEEEFEQTYAYLEKIKFFEMHIFKYSRRAGTVADRMPNQLTEKVKAARSDKLQSLEEYQSKEFRAYYLDKEVEVLLEEKKEIEGKSYWIGHTREYVKVAVEADAKSHENEQIYVKPYSFLKNEIIIAH